MPLSSPPLLSTVVHLPKIKPTNFISHRLLSTIVEFSPLLLVVCAFLVEFSGGFHKRFVGLLAEDFVENNKLFFPCNGPCSFLEYKILEYKRFILSLSSSLKERGYIPVDLLTNAFTSLIITVVSSVERPGGKLISLMIRFVRFLETEQKALIAEEEEEELLRF